MNYRVYKNGEMLKTRVCTIFPMPYNSESVMEYVMLTVKPHTELVIESEEKVLSVCVRPVKRRCMQILF